MASITRYPAKAAATEHDLIIIGGGIYGVMLALEAGKRGKRALLLEKDDFGGATSRNHLRTVHGGLRYLQSLDVPRFYESVPERLWFMANFPALVHVLPCLMPLYGRGLMRPGILRAGLLLNDVLSIGRNRGLAAGSRLPMGRIIGRDSTRRLFPQVDPRGLKGAALWYDAAMPEHQRLLLELLRWAGDLGATALNYVEADHLLLQKGRVRGVVAADRESAQNLEFRAPVVINAAGPWCRELAKKFDQDHPSLLRRRLLLFNILFRTQALSEYALALVPPGRPGHTYFVHNWQGRLLAGTGEVLLADDDRESLPRPADIAGFIADMNDAVPDLSLGKNDIEWVYSGILPASASGKLAARETILDHGKHLGPEGLFSVSGVKYTTSRRVAEKTLKNIFPHVRAKRCLPPEAANSRRGFFTYDWQAGGDWDANALRSLVEEEAVMHLDDLLFRRTGLGENPRRAMDLLPRLRSLFQWSDARWRQECERVIALLDARV